MTRAYLLSSLTVLISLTLAACAAPQAAPSPAPNSVTESGATSNPDSAWQKILEAGKQEGKVLIYGALLGGPEGSAIAEQFRKDTGISVDFVAGAGSPLYQRIREETKGGAPSADIFEGSQPWPSIVQKDGFFTPIKEQPLPELRNASTAFRVNPTLMSDTGSYLISRFPSNVGHVVVNTQLLKPADYPKSYHDIATDRRFLGKIAWVNPKSTGDVAYKWTVWGYNANVFTLDDVWTIYSKQDPLMLAAPMDGAGALARGEAMLSFSTGSIEGPADAGAPIKVILFPDTPFVDSVAGMGLVKDAPHPNAALVFANWVLSKPGQEAITRIAKIRSIRKDVPDGGPESIKPEVVGGGSRGPTYLLTAAQAELAGDMHAAKIFQSLPDGIGQTEFVNGVNTYIADWEARRGGPQRQQIKLEE